jgi:hypothetical protein
VSGDGNARVALPLVLLGTLYGRTARATLAEGLYREAAKMLRLAPGPLAPELSLVSCLF